VLPYDIHFARTARDFVRYPMISRRLLVSLVRLIVSYGHLLVNSGYLLVNSARLLVNSRCTHDFAPFTIALAS